MLTLQGHKPVGHLMGLEDNGKEEEIRRIQGRRRKRKRDKIGSGEGRRETRIPFQIYYQLLLKYFKWSKYWLKDAHQPQTFENKLLKIPTVSG